MADTKPRVDLIPWDFDSEEHQQRMYLQRVACGWRSDEVQRWVELGKAGQKTLYWILLAEDLSDRETLTSKHTAEFPKESAPITDTVTTHWQKPRKPSKRAFIPIGHVALDIRPEDYAHLKLTDDGIVWVAGLYISWGLQSQGFGREAMGVVERIASLEPLSATWIVLDTMPRDQQVKSAFIKKALAAQGKPSPGVLTQTWYEKQGYEVFARDVAVYSLEDEVTGETESFDYLYLMKNLT
ncbi:hypothetical protein DHEL01_v200496 [Diaporthe helianthi]|uniref:N-acetyltransferase domain-containing protein n=1 Tax=Diaporthe helianthi TaxID=158607 RepID=A0A2P5IF69_DIAHE|nr:hypothetical protein DHEL01_v200496 [Diaporthe helianthi]